MLYPQNCRNLYLLNELWTTGLSSSQAPRLLARPSYRMSPSELAELQKQLDYSKTVSSAVRKHRLGPCTLPEEARWKLTFVRGLRALNKVTIKNKHPILLIVDLFN